jgi:hypothetical protein
MSLVTLFPGDRNRKIRARLMSEPEKFGPGLHAALKVYQTKHQHLAKTGLVDKATLLQLRQDLSAFSDAGSFVKHSWLHRGLSDASHRPLGSPAPAGGRVPAGTDDDSDPEVVSPSEEVPFEGPLPSVESAAPASEDVPGLWGGDPEASSSIADDLENELARSAASKARFVRDQDGNILQLASAAEVPRATLSERYVSAARGDDQPATIESAVKAAGLQVGLDASKVDLQGPKVDPPAPTVDRLVVQADMSRGGAANLFLNKRVGNTGHPKLRGLSGDPGTGRWSALARRGLVYTESQLSNTFGRTPKDAFDSFIMLGEKGNRFYIPVDSEFFEHSKDFEGDMSDYLRTAANSVSLMGSLYSPLEDPSQGALFPTSRGRENLADRSKLEVLPFEARRVNYVIQGNIHQPVINAGNVMQRQAVDEINKIRKAKASLVKSSVDASLNALDQVFKSYNIMTGSRDDLNSMYQFVQGEAVRAWMDKNPEQAEDFKRNYTREQHKKAVIRQLNNMKFRVLVNGQEEFKKLSEISGVNEANRIADALLGNMHKPAVFDEIISMATAGARPSTVSSQTVSNAFEHAREYATGMYMMFHPEGAALLLQPSLGTDEKYKSALADYNHFIQVGQSSVKAALIDYEQDPGGFVRPKVDSSPVQLVEREDRSGFNIVKDDSASSIAYSPAVRQGTGVPERLLRIYDRFDSSITPRVKRDETARSRGRRARKMGTIRTFSGLRNRRLRDRATVD